MLTASIKHPTAVDCKTATRIHINAFCPARAQVSAAMTEKVMGLGYDALKSVYDTFFKTE